MNRWRRDEEHGWEPNVRHERHRPGGGMRDKNRPNHKREFFQIGKKGGYKEKGKGTRR